MEEREREREREIERERERNEGRERDNKKYCESVKFTMPTCNLKK